MNETRFAPNLCKNCAVCYLTLYFTRKLRRIRIHQVPREILWAENGQIQWRIV